MLAYQMRGKAKQGQTQKLIDLVLSEVAADRDRSNHDYVFRAYTPELGQPWDEVVLEWEYENLTDYEQMWAKWWAQPTTPEYMKKWSELAEPGFVTTMWNLRTP
jgi:hypothetical protein